MIIAVDFDGTLCEHKFPEIGKPFLGVINYIKKRKEKGDLIVLWTCREGELLDKAVEWCKEQGIELDAVNEDVRYVQVSDFGKNKSAKIYADVYIDDRNFKTEDLVEMIHGNS